MKKMTGAIAFACAGLLMAMMIAGCSGRSLELPQERVRDVVIGENNQQDDSVNSPEFDRKRHVRYTGRIDWRDPDGPVLSWAGSSIALRFQGSALTMKLVPKERSESWVNIKVDGGPPQKLYIDANTPVVTIAEGLNPDEEHTVEIYKRTEAMFGTIQLHGFELPDGGEFLAPPARPERKIEIIGDSISAGSGNEGKDGDPNIAEHENNWLAYGALAARYLNAEHHTTAVSGIGLTVNYGDERVNTMLDQYERLNPLHEEPKWDFEQWTPDVVVINLGTNDNNYEIDKDDFVAKYVGFVERVRSRYPEAHIFITLGPFQLKPVQDYIFDAFGVIRQAGDKRVHCFIFREANRERDGMGETGHPNTITHALMADQLVGEIMEKTGWSK